MRPVGVVKLKGLVLGFLGASFGVGDSCTEKEKKKHMLSFHTQFEVFDHFRQKLGLHHAYAHYAT